MRLRGLGVLLTGASGGIGAALACELARRGCRLALVARNGEALGEVVKQVEALGGQARAFPVDVSQGDLMQQVAKEAATFLRPWQVVIANAGVGYHGPGTTLEPQVASQIMAVNWQGVVHTLTASLPYLQKPQALGVVSSLSALIPYRGGGLYAASKAAVNAYLRCLRLEIQAPDVTLGWICPGPVATKMIREGVPHGKLPRLARWLVPVLSPEVVAQKLVRLLEKGGGERVIPWQAAFFASFYRHFPRLAQALLRLSGAGQV
jgi:short-subunit dehydrogenase